MDFLINYIELGIIINLICIIPEFGLALYITLNLDLVQMQKLASKSEDELNNVNNYLAIIHRLIPFYSLYLLIIQFLVTNKYFDRTTDSLDIIIKEMDKYKIFKRFK